jgi:uncharacterized membrane protein YqjE
MSDVDTPGPASGVLTELSGMIASAHASVSNFLELVTLEAQRAGFALVWMIAWGGVAALCIAATWIGLLVALVMWTVSLGLSPPAAVALFALLNLLLAGVLVRVCMGLSRDLLFPATRRQLARDPGPAATLSTS